MKLTKEQKIALQACVYGTVNNSKCNGAIYFKKSTGERMPFEQAVYIVMNMIEDAEKEEGESHE